MKITTHIAQTYQIGLYIVSFGKQVSLVAEGYRHATEGYRHTTKGYRSATEGVRHAIEGYRHATKGYRSAMEGYRHGSYKGTKSALLNNKST